MTKGTKRLTTVMTVRFSPDELEAVQTQANELKLSLSEYVRSLVIDADVPFVNFDEIPQYAKDVLYGYNEGYRAALVETSRRAEEIVAQHSKKDAISQIASLRERYER